MYIHAVYHVFGAKDLKGPFLIEGSNMDELGLLLRPTALDLVVTHGSAHECKQQ